MVSMKEIAKQCNVSVATVSKALNGYSDIGEETKNYILRTASEMGYLPNSSARALKTKRTFNLGVLFVDEARSGLTHDYFNRVLESFKSTAEAKGYDITFTSGNVSGKRMTYLEHCRYRGVDGVVMACVDFTAEEVQELLLSDIPVVRNHGSSFSWKKYMPSFMAFDLKTPTDRSRSDCVHEQVAKRTFQVRFADR